MITSLKVTTGVPAQLSVAVGVPVAAGAVLSSKLIVRFGGHVITGGVMSFTVIIWLHVAEFPHTSVARYVLVNVNLLGQVIFVMTSPTCVIVAAPPQLSDEVTLPV